MAWASKLGALLRDYFVDIFRQYPFLIPLAGLTALGQINAAVINSYAFSFYILDDLKYSGSVLGYLTGAYLFMETLLKLPFGHLSDQHGRRPYIIGGLIATGITPLVIVLLPDSLLTRSLFLMYVILVPLRMLGGAGAAAIWPPAYAVVPDHVEEEHRGAAMAVVNSAYAGGIAVGPAVAAALASLGATRHVTFHEKVPFVLAAACAFIGAWVALWLPKEDRARGRQERAREALPPWGVIVVVVVVTAAEFFATASLAPYLAPYMRVAAHITRAQVGYYQLALGIPVVLLGIPIGRLADVWPKELTRKVALWLCAVGMWFIPLVSGSVWLIVAVGGVVIVGFLFGANVWSALISDIAPESGRGKMLGIMATAQGVGAFLGPVASGYLWDRSIHYPFYASAVSLTLGAIVATLFVTRDWEKYAHHQEE